MAQKAKGGLGEFWKRAKERGYDSGKASGTKITGRRHRGKEQLRGIIDWLDSIEHGPIAAARPLALFRLAQFIGARVSSAYREYESEPSETERRTREVGKEKGAVRAARLPRDPINIFAKLAQHIVVTKMAAKGDTNHWYRIQHKQDVVATSDPSGPRPGGHNYPGGIPISLMAHWIENPKPITIQMTRRQLGYLYAVREGRGGFGTRARSQRGGGHLPDLKVSFVMHLQMPDRPVWRKVAAEILKIGRQNFTNPYFRVLRQAGIRYGMK